MRSGKRFCWNMFLDRGEALKRYFTSKEFDSVELAQTDAEQIEAGRAAADAMAATKSAPSPEVEDAPKRARKLKIAYVDEPAPAVTPPRIEQRAGELIAWSKKKHPTKVAVGISARTERRYAIDRVKNAVVGGPDKKGRTRRVSQTDLARYRWFCVTDGASSIEEFRSIEAAQASASRAEESFQKSKGA